jgi:hypothetical protein
LLALVATLLIGVYVFGPTLVARRVLDFVVPRRNLAQSKSEEILPGILWSIIPFWLAWLVRHVGPYSLPPNAKVDLQVFFSGLESDLFSNSNRAAFFSSAESFWQLNVCVSLRLYAIVIALSLLFNVLISYYGRMRTWLAPRRNVWAILKWILGIIVLPRISEWHVILSNVLLPSKDMTIEVDVLTKSGILYKGRLSENVLAPTGDLQSLTLDSPQRFRREQYLEAVKAGKEPKAEAFWKPIPGNIFVIIASDIASLNVRHIPAVREFGVRFNDIRDAMKGIEAALKEIQKKRAGTFETPTTPGDEPAA